MINYSFSKKLIIIFSASVMFAFPVFADDGSWSKSFSVSGGSVYSQEDNSDIILEKELLVFNGKSTEACFEFVNTSRSKIVLTCGFPVVHKIATYMHDGYAEIPLSKYGGETVPGIVFFETSVNPEYSDDEPMFVYPEVILDNSFNSSREYIGPDMPQGAGIDFSIEQDGKVVAIEDILLEREVNEEFASLTFHYKHQLEFEPGSSSTVIVTYSQDLLYGNDGGAASDVFKWNYIIGTGGTWKGPIGKFFFIKPSGWEGELSGMQRINRRMKDGVDIYYVENYEPKRSDEFSLRSQPVDLMKEYSLYSDFPDMKNRWAERILTFPFSKEPVQNFVKAVTASSALADHIDVFAYHAVIESAEFSPVAAFDGFYETSWCENVSGSGLGEYIEFELTEPVSGFIISNGFKRFTIDDWVFDSGYFERSIRDDSLGLKDYFKMNSRVKSMEIKRLDGFSYNIVELSDQRDPQTFFGCNLLPGRYRFTINDTYPGSKWEDTCLAEITFIPDEKDSLMSTLFTDDFFSRMITFQRYEQ